MVNGDNELIRGERMRKTIQDIKEEQIADYKKTVKHVRSTYQRESAPKIRYPFGYKKCVKCNNMVKLEKVYFISGSSLSSFAFYYHNCFGCKECFENQDDFYNYAVNCCYIPSEDEYVYRHMKTSEDETEYLNKVDGSIDWKRMANNLINCQMARLN